MNKNFLWVLAVLFLLPGCGGGNKEAKKTQKAKKVAMHETVDIPVVEEIHSYFDEDVSEFALRDDEENNDDLDVAQSFDANLDAAFDANIDSVEQASVDNLDDDFFWIEDVDIDQDSLEPVYFGFGKYEVKDDQEEHVNKNIDLVKRMLDRGENPLVTIEGNSCSSAGSRTYNLALSNNRAEVIADRFVANGVPRENIKVVGRGSDNPALDDEGNPVAGNRDQQWPNRRVEVKVY